LNLGLCSGATVAGFIVASAQHLRSFQTLYLFDAITYAAFALIVLAMVPNRRAAAAHAGAVERGFRAVARDRKFLIVIAVNIVLIIVGYTLFANILPPFAKAHTRVGPAAIGILFLFNTSFIVIAQLPATRVVKRMRRAQAFAAASALWAIALLGVLLATLIHSELGAAALLAGVATVFAIGECVHAVVLGPLIADLAPPHLLGRYISLYSLMVTGGLALSPGHRWRSAHDLTRRRLVGWRPRRRSDRSGLSPLRRLHPEPLAVEAGVPDVGEGPRAATQATS
jgi:Na+/melibiose symporter-like transporter